MTKSEREVVERGSAPEARSATELLKANEQLVLAAMRAQTEAEDAARKLNEIARSAERDALTGLPDRALLFDRFARAIAGAKRRSNRLALLFIDVDNFKQINDTLGHRVGDEVLKRVAHCLVSSVRDADTVSRHGGDEFLILLTEVTYAADAVLIARKVIAALGASARVGEHTLQLKASIGISIYPDDGDDPDTLIDRADAAMYRAKRHRHGGMALHGTEFRDRRSRDIPTVESRPRSPTLVEPDLAAQERRNSQLRTANEQLLLPSLSAREAPGGPEQANGLEMEFHRVLAHERRHPWTAIRRAAALLGRVRTEEMSWVQAIIERHVEQLTRRVSELLAVARASTGNVMLEKRVVDMSRLVDTAVAACRPAMDARRQQFRLQLPAVPPEVHGDTVRLGQVLCNLLDNASRYTPDGGEIGLAVAVAGDAVALTVSDNGKGISADALPRIFEPFVQDPHSTGLSGEGLGIGLSVVRKLVEAHGGNVIAHSAGCGLGSRFIFTLPLNRTPVS